MADVLDALKHYFTKHSVSKETHHEFTGFPCYPGSRSSDPGGVTFDHAYLKQVAKDPIQKRPKWFSQYLEMSKGLPTGLTNPEN